MTKTNFKKLKQTLELAFVKKNGSPRSASVAFSKSGQTYAAGNIESDTHLLDISSEQVALALSVLARDYGVYKISTIAEKIGAGAPLSPIVAKIIIDHQIRTGEKIECEILNADGKEIFWAKDLAKNLPFYNPAPVPLKMISAKASPSPNTASFPKGGKIEKVLKEFALKGLERNFPTYDSASGYGSAVLTKNGKIYFGGQYSSFDKRLGLHSEMTAILSALMDKNFDITHLGIVSTKFPDAPCNSCGPCRQFIAEIENKFGATIEIFTFAKDNDQFEKHFIAEYLPNKWEI